MKNKFYFRRQGRMLAPWGEDAIEKVESLSRDEILQVEITRPRNPGFHRKFFAMLNFAFDYWEPDYEAIDQALARRGLSTNLRPVKSFDRFRADVMIKAGYYTLGATIDGDVLFEPQSIAFAKMDDEAFAEVYKTVFNVLWELVFAGGDTYTEAEVENAINQLISFD